MINKMKIVKLLMKNLLLINNAKKILRPNIVKNVIN